MAKFEEISTLLQRGKAKDLAALVTEELAAGVAPKDILTEGLIAGMGIVGTKFKNNEIFVPEVLIAARAMNAALAVLKPALADSGVEPVGTAVICTVKGGDDDAFYEKVKAILLAEGEVSDAIGRLTDRAYYDTLTYEEKQRYTLTLSERYLKALERFRREAEYEGCRRG